jgi:hypothetical protein
VLNRRFPAQQLLRNRDHVVEVRIRRVNDNEFELAEALGVVLRFAFIEPHEIVLLPQTGNQFSHEQYDETEMSQQDARFFPLEPETVGMGRDEVQQKQAADRVSAGESRHRDATNGEVDDKGAKILLLHGRDAEVHLVQRAGKDKHHAEDKQHNREAQGDENVSDLTEQVFHEGGGKVAFTNRSKRSARSASFCQTTVQLAPHILRSSPQSL